MKEKEEVKPEAQEFLEAGFISTMLYLISYSLPAPAPGSQEQSARDLGNLEIRLGRCLCCCLEILRTARLAAHPFTR